MAAISPDAENYDQTLSTLKYGENKQIHSIAILVSVTVLGSPDRVTTHVFTQQRTLYSYLLRFPLLFGSKLLCLSFFVITSQRDVLPCQCDKTIQE